MRWQFEILGKMPLDVLVRRPHFNNLRQYCWENKKITLPGSIKVAATPTPKGWLVTITEDQTA